ncbi:MAG: tocopherol cyclase family protein [Synechococcales cyanobacterium]
MGKQDIKKEDRPLPGVTLAAQVPHRGYHGDSFEGWYVRVGPFAFMYAWQDQGTLQLVGPGDRFWARSLTEPFWAWRYELGFGQGSPKWVEPSQFFHQVAQGYQVTPTVHQGNFAEVRWQFQIQPHYGWGQAQATAGWLSFCPGVDPGWQILMAHGWANGWIEWQGQRYSLEQSPAYIEKNWGHAFPRHWSWIQCNAFSNHPDLTLTAVAARRRLFAWEESVGMIGLHHQGHLWEFAPWNARLSWQIAPWGSWRMTGKKGHQRVEIEGICTGAGTQVFVPTSSGWHRHCRDTLQGTLRVQLWQGSRLILRAESERAGLEVGGTDWGSPWIHNT